MKHLDLFSGIGGFALATEMVWDNVEHIFCDNEPFAQAVLKKHWPNSTIYGDIRTLTADAHWSGSGTSERGIDENGTEKNEGWEKQPLTQSRRQDFDLLTGGFPCQPFSQAGARRGTEDSRHLWPEMLRVIREFHPRWVIGENVGGLVTWSEGLVLEQVHTDLEGQGYEVQAFIIPAVAVNAPHRRDRVWIVGYNDSNGRTRGNKKINTAETREQTLNKFTRRYKNGINASNGPGKGLEGGDLSKEPGKKEWRRDSRQIDWNQNWLEVATRLCRVDDELSYWVDGRGKKRNSRNPRLKALGNAIVPAVAAEIMRVIKEIDL